jgi:hypothetical protein
MLELEIGNGKSEATYLVGCYPSFDNHYLEI